MDLDEARALRAEISEIEAALGRVEPLLRRVVSIGYQAEACLATLKRIDVLTEAILIRKHHLGLEGWSEVKPE
jgi:hypothetical protein